MLFDALADHRADPMENPSHPLTGEDLSEYIRTSVGASVSEEMAMKLSAVYACLYVLSSSLAQLPLHVLRKKDRVLESATDHAAYYLLHDEPNAWQSSYDWRETGQLYTSGWGNGLTRIIRNQRGEAQELTLCKPWQSALVKNGGRYVYAVRDEEEGAFAVAPEDMIHVRALGSDSRWGKSPIRQHAETIGLGLAVQRYGSAFFQSGGRPTGVLTPKGGISEKGWDSLKEFWKRARGRLNSDDSKTLLLPGDLEYKVLTVSPQDAQFIDARKMTRSEIAGIFNVPSHMINDLERATFSNISEQSVGFVRHTMMPWVVKWEQEINRKLFTRQERRAGYYVKFNLAGLLRGTQKERAEFYHYGITDGWISRNEARIFEDLNPVDGLDKFLVSVNAAKLAADTLNDKPAQ